MEKGNSTSQVFFRRKRRNHGILADGNAARSRFARNSGRVINESKSKKRRSSAFWRNGFFQMRNESFSGLPRAFSDGPLSRATPERMLACFPIVLGCFGKALQLEAPAICFHEEKGRSDLENREECAVLARRKDSNTTTVIRDTEQDLHV